MSTLTKSLLGDYSNAISQFQFACLGSYSGPSMPMNLLGELVGAVDGIAPENLVKNLSLIHISEPTRRLRGSRMPSSA